MISPRALQQRENARGLSIKPSGTPVEKLTGPNIDHPMSPDMTMHPDRKQSIANHKFQDS